MNPLLNLNIPLIDQNQLEIKLEKNKPTFILGANGSGKSSLIYFIQRLFPDNHLISANRANWLDNETISLGGNTKEEYKQWIKNSTQKESARWNEHHYLEKPKVSLIHLIDSEYERSRKITALMDNEEFEEAKKFSLLPSTIHLINELFRVCNLNIEIEVVSNSKINANKDGQAYSISKMSDGERNALLIATNVLTAEKDQLIIIDEPERHLHHSITIPFINNLMKLRPDLIFLISTHDIGFAQSFNDSQFLMLNECKYIDNHNILWDAQLLSMQDMEGLEGISRNILGSRKDIIFIEGENSSLDLPLYSLIFPNISIVSKASCKDVIQNVRGISSSTFLHWLNVYGIIDGDGRSDEERSNLLIENVFCLNQYSIESIYYQPFIQNKLYIAKKELEGDSNIFPPSSYISDIIEILNKDKIRLCNRVIEKTVRNQFETKFPTQKDISDNDKYEISINLEEIRNTESQRFDQWIVEGNISSLINRYPIRETQVLNLISKKLGFQTRGNYENTVIQILKKDTEALNFVKAYFSELLNKLSNN